jgi:hypothetical protein
VHAATKKTTKHDESSNGVERNRDVENPRTNPVSMKNSRGAVKWNVMELDT